MKSTARLDRSKEIFGLPDRGCQAIAIPCFCRIGHDLAQELELEEAAEEIIGFLRTGRVEVDSR